MELNKLPKPLKTIPFTVRMAVYLGIVLLMSNINPIVDMFEHPEIPYFDEEHLIVGIIDGIISVILLVILEIYFRYLHKALQKIKQLESYLSICASCKRIRIPGTDPQKQESWQPIESYITEKTQTIFSHGICPTCLAKYHSQLGNKQNYK